MSAPMTPELAHAIVVKWMDNSDPDRESLLSQAIELVLAEVERLTYLLGSHADGHRCTCTMTDPGIRHGDNAHPPEWEQDPWCPTHPDMDAILAEVDRLRAREAVVDDFLAERRAYIRAIQVSPLGLWTVPNHLTGDLK